MKGIDLQPLVFERAVREIEEYWARGGDSFHPYEKTFAIAGTEHDQLVPEGIENPYWELIRRIPSLRDVTWRGVTPYGHTIGLDVGRTMLVGTYAWSIPSPGDIAWVAGLLDGRKLVEVGAGSGYWAWQLSQAGVDVVAYEPNPATENSFVAVLEPYAPLLRGDASAAARHPDRALFLSWPNYSEPWGAHALASYAGDLLFYVGEGEGGCCADDSFFELLNAEWSEIGDSPHHRTWWGINDRLTAYRRAR
ncbi:hypothetical protein [Streptomyces sp.]|uniref:hypothetical protein n=1 Tax=Streptomyces sp. TaxID=1931 RepID=UPI002F95150B